MAGKRKTKTTQPSLAEQRRQGRYYATTWHKLSPEERVQWSTQVDVERRKRQRIRDRERRLRRRQECQTPAVGENAAKAIRNALRKGYEFTKYRAVLGYSAAELRAHIESLFQPGMSWENRKDWHIDHIRPMASFKFTSIDDPSLRKCFALSNLQPLWSHENCLKDAWWSCLSKRQRQQQQRVQGAWWSTLSDPQRQQIRKATQQDQGHAETAERRRKREREREAVKRGHRFLRVRGDPSQPIPRL